MRGLALTIIIVAFAFFGYSQALEVKRLRAESKDSPMGLVVAKPNLSWELVSKGRNVTQKAYHILVATDSLQLAREEGNIWNSGKVNSAQSIQVPYQGKALTPDTYYYWKVKVWDNKGHQSAWSDVAKWQMGLPDQAAWKGAQWIAFEALPPNRVDPLPKSDKKDTVQDNNVLPIFRKSLQIKKKIAKATLYISGLGHFELHLNGRKVGDHFLDAGWTKYDKEALYETFDVSSYLQQGENVIGVLLGNGFYYIPPVKGRYRKQKVTFGYPKMICRLHLAYQDGSVEDVISNEQWKTAKSPITFSSIYGGEDYDARLEQQGWDSAGFADRNWKAALVVDGPPLLQPQMADPLKVMQQFTSKSIQQTPKSTWVYDLGQNASGIIELKVKGKRGDTVRIYPGELLKDGAVTQKATGSPFYFEYVLKGEKEECWQPRFTYYGFRYLEVRGAVPVGKDNPEKQAQVTALQGLHTRNAAERIGSFNCSSDLFNKIYTLIDWSVKSNMASVFTDCPHREKLGWLEQTHLMGASIQYNYAVHNLFKKVVNDMQHSQLANGLVPAIAPEYVEFNWGGDMFRDSPEWGSASIILPWYCYKWYGDREMIRTAYPMMKKYLQYLATKANNQILTQGLGDWYDLGPKPPGVSQLTPMGVTGTAIYYYDLQLMQRMAALMGYEEDQQHYKELAEKVKKAFNQQFFDSKTAQYASGSQTANAMPLYVELVDATAEEKVLKNLISDIRSRNNSLTAGDIGYRYVLRVLEQEGYSKVIYDMNSRSDVPGYGYQLAKGATALTESWQTLPTVSNNHLMLGHLMEWFYSGLAGIRMADEGVAYNKIKIHPDPVGTITHAEASFHSPYGEIMSRWKQENGTFVLEVNIPVNTQAKVYLPRETGDQVFEGGRPINQINDVEVLGQEGDRLVVALGSGTYTFLVAKKKAI